MDKEKPLNNEQMKMLIDMFLEITIEWHETGKVSDDTMERAHALLVTIEHENYNWESNDEDTNN